MPERLDEAALLQVAHRVGGRAHAGHYHRAGRIEGPRIGRHLRLKVDVLHGAGDAAEVPRAVIEHDDALGGHCAVILTQAPMVHFLSQHRQRRRR